MTVIADSREPNGHHFETEELPAGDYVITGEAGGVICERKTWNDLVSSMRSGKLYQQLRMCAEQEDYRTVLLIEGNRANAIKYANSSNRELRRFLSSVVANMPEVQLVFTRSKKETFSLISDIDDWLSHDSEYNHSIRETEKVPADRRPEYILLGLPNVGPTKASEMLNEFGDALSVLTASEEELQQISGVGPKTANQIRDALTR